MQIWTAQATSYKAYETFLQQTVSFLPYPIQKYSCKIAQDWTFPKLKDHSHGSSKAISKKRKMRSGQMDQTAAEFLL